MEAENDSTEAELNSANLTLDRQKKEVRYRNAVKHRLHGFSGEPEYFQRQPVPLERFVSIAINFFAHKIRCDLDRLCLDVYPNRLVVRIYDGAAPLGRLTKNSSGFRANLHRINYVSRVRFATFLDRWSEHSPEYAKHSSLYACPATLRVDYFSD
jgi:hypothetical protein